MPVRSYTYIQYRWKVQAQKEIINIPIRPLTVISAKACFAVEIYCYWWYICTISQRERKMMLLGGTFTYKQARDDFRPPPGIVCVCMYHINEFAAEKTRQKAPKTCRDQGKIIMSLRVWRNTHIHTVRLQFEWAQSFAATIERKIQWPTTRLCVYYIYSLKKHQTQYTPSRYPSLCRKLVLSSPSLIISETAESRM